MAWVWCAQRGRSNLPLLLAILLCLCSACAPFSRGPDDAQMAEIQTPTSSVYDRALAAYDEGRFNDALALLTPLLQSNPSAGALNLRGMIRQQQGDHATAIDDFSQALASDRTFVESLNNRALSYQALNQLDLAEADYRTAIAQEATLGPAHYNLGILLYTDGRLPEAVAALEQAVNHLPNDGDAWFQLGLAYDRHNQPEAAIDAFGQAIAIEQGFDDQSYYLRGILLLEIDRPAEAEADFDEAIVKGLRNADTLFYRGLARYAQSRLEEAATDFNEALTYDPRFADAHYYLSYTYAQLGDQDAARNHAQAALELDPPSLEESP